MNKWYCGIIAIILGLASFQTTWGIVFYQPFRQGFFDLALLKSLLLFTIFFVEAFNIQNKTLRIIGFLLPFILLLGLAFRIMHWPWGNELIIFTFTAILINSIEPALREKNKHFFSYILFVFIADRFMIVIWPPNEIIWMFDYLLCFLIFIVSCVLLLRKEVSNKV